MTKKNLYIIIAVLSFALIGCLVMMYGKTGGKEKDDVVISAQKTGEDKSPVKNTQKAEESKDIIVDVGGAVKKPGVYHFESGDRIIDALNMAQGLNANADVSSINLAKKLTDEEKIYVPQKGEKTNNAPGGTDATNTSTSGQADNGGTGKININNATLEELDKLPGIGPTLAQRIIDYRTNNGGFKSVEDIKNVSRIGDKIFEQIENLITVDINACLFTRLCLY